MLRNGYLYAALVGAAGGCSSGSHAGSAALADTASRGTLSARVFHGIPAGTFGDSQTELALMGTYAASATPAYTFTDEHGAFEFSGSSSPTSSFLGVDAAGAATSDAASVGDTILDAQGYFRAPTAGAYTFHLGVTDDAAGVYIDGNGTSGSGRLVVSNSYTTGSDRSATVTLAASAAIHLEVLYGNGYGGAGLDGVRIEDPSGQQVTYSAPASGGSASGSGGSGDGTGGTSTGSGSGSAGGGSSSGGLAAGIYVLENLDSQQALTVNSAISYDGNVVLTYAVNDGAGQQFELTPGSNGSYTLREQIGQRCLDASGTEATSLTIATCSGAATQSFVLAALPGGAFTLTTSTGACVTGQGTYNLVIDSACTGSASQQWSFETLGGGSGSAGGSGGSTGGGTADAGAGSESPDASAPTPPTGCAKIDPSSAPSTIDPSCFTTTFNDDFASYDISSGPFDDGQHAGEKWFNGTDQCCMSPSNGWPGVMFPTASQTTGQAVNPYSLLPGGGLQISLTETNDEWFSGILTSVDGNENGFSQAYGYFEMSTQLPPGTGTWPSFWMLSLPRSAPGGEIDIFEQLGCSPPLNPAVESIFHFTLHDWKGGTTPFAYTAANLPDLTAAYHRYGMLWNRTYMALYFDGALLASSPTPAVMIDTKYFLLADLGIGAGWDTTQTPNPSNMLVKYIRAYSVPGFSTQ